MHITTKEVDDNGVHILTSQIEGDGPVALASDQATLSASVISIQRTESGGIKVQVAVKVSEPAPEKPKSTTPNDIALAYLASKGITGDDAKKDLEKFGASRILAAKAKADADENASLDEELAKKLS